MLVDFSLVWSPKMQQVHGEYPFLFGWGAGEELLQAPSLKAMCVFLAPASLLLD
jgi:hypothetical protein